ncbi:MAG: hypothetical protein ACT4QE_19130 [Anaerolineales bacterium]
MTNSNSQREGEWAKPVGKLKVSPVAAGGINLNVEGKQLTGPLKGFGQMWQKTYSVRLTGADVTPQAVVKVWQAEFPNFWPTGNRIYAPLTGLQPGGVAVLNLAGPGGMTAPGGGPLISTGIMVIYADDESFSFMTPEGHIFAGMITFSAHEDEGATVAQIQALIRANDPLYELGCRVGVVHKTEDDFWQATLRSLAARFGVNGQPQQRNVLVDPRIQWSAAGNVWHNSAIRTALYLPVALARRMFGK